MRLVYKIVLRISIAVVILFTFWGVIFYYSILEEVNDELNDALEVYSDQIIKRTLAGKELPAKFEGSNNVFYIEKVSSDYALKNEWVSYRDTTIFIPERREFEPARMLRTLFRDKEDHYYQLTVLTPTIEKKDLLETIFTWLAILYGLLLLTIILVNAWVFNRSLNPLYKLLKWVNQYTLGANNPPLNNDTNIKEFQRLNDALIRHINRSEKTYNEQKTFIGNASHEMQTPLAICINRLEWLIDRPDLTEEHLEELIKVKQTLSYLVRLNKTLLFLSKIENRQFPEQSIIHFNELIKEHLEDYEEIYAHKKIKTQFIESAEVRLEMNETLAVSLITNLLRNAYVHTLNGGKLQIILQEKQLVFSNQTDCGALDETKIFQRFQQEKKKEGSTGLGLVIVRSICNTYGLSINYYYQDAYHHFVLKW